jgi:Uma2 family endonuclease
MDPNTYVSAAGDRRMAEAARNQTLYEALEALPEGLTGEILDGQLHTQPQPTARHQAAASKLGGKLIDPYSEGKGGPGGWWIIDEPEIHFVRDKVVVVPDLAAWRRERMPDLPVDQRFEVVPDWVCEILSPSTRSKDREIKMPLYARHGVGNAWLIDPDAETLEAYELRGAEWTQLGVYGVDDTPAAAPFEVAAFRVGDLWR